MTPSYHSSENHEQKVGLPLPQRFFTLKYFFIILAGLQMRRGLPALIRDREMNLHLHRGPFLPYRCAGDRPVAKRALISFKALGQKCINQTYKTDENIAFKCNIFGAIERALISMACKTIDNVDVFTILTFPNF